MQKAVVSSGGIWAESNFKNSLSFAGKNKVRRKVASATSFAHKGSGEPALLRGLLPLRCPPGLWHFAVVPPKETPLACLLTGSSCIFPFHSAAGH